MKNNHGYDAQGIEQKWQRYWADHETFHTKDSVEGKENLYILSEFSYPSGNLHVGHWYAFALPDIYVRFKRMQGYNVLYPTGFDAFGLPAENAAIKRGADPKTWTWEHMDHMRKQLKTMGASFDWSREIVTADPDYYRWTQWMFLKFYEHDLVYRGMTKVNWDPVDKTILANEQVIDGKSERSGAEVVQKDMSQWMLNITDFADELVDDLEELPWSQAIKASQREWIGRKEGSLIPFEIREVGQDESTIGAGAFLKTRDGKYLFQERDSGPEHFPGLITLFGGGIQENETARQAIIRELQEELNLIVTNEDLTFIALQDHLKIAGKNSAIFLIENVDPLQLNLSEGKAIVELDFDEISQHEKTGYFEKLYTSEKKDILLRKDSSNSCEVFTTRADTLFGVTYIVLAPEHDLVATLQDRIKNWDEVQEYLDEVAKKSDLDRQQAQEKTGVVLEGIEAINPANGEAVPVWIADYVLAHFGTGAVMAVPVHDERDFEFAQKFDLPIQQVISEDILNTDLKVTENLRRRDSAVALVRNKKNEYLIEYSQTGQVYKLPGGKIEKGEAIEEALRREIKKETGYCNIKIVKKIETIRTRYLSKKAKTEVESLRHVFLVDISEADKTNPTPEHYELQDEYYWLTEHEFLKKISLQESKTNLGEYRVASRFFKNKIFSGEGILYNSNQFDGELSQEAQQKITKSVGGTITKTYRLRDWGISRQRYWGCPIPIVYDPEGNPHPVPYEHLPWTLPDDVDHTPDGTAPLARSAELQKRTEDIFGPGWTPEVDTMDTFVDSSWYFYRYLDPHNQDLPVSQEIQQHWMPVNTYFGGAEHTTMHLLYSRFWTKALHKIGLVTDPEPYHMRYNRGLILGPDQQKMSKSKGNVIDPDEVVGQVGADTVRSYLAFIGPFNEPGNYPWDPNGVVGVRRFLERVWRLQEKVVSTGKDSGDAHSSRDSSEIISLIHKTIKKVTEDINKLKYNTALSALMILVNTLEKQDQVIQEHYLMLVQMIAPYAPHLAEELWELQGRTASIHHSQWPEFQSELLVEDNITVVVQINGKVRAQMSIAADEDQKSIETRAQALSEVQKWIDGKNIKKIIYVPQKILNIVIKQ